MSLPPPVELMFQPAEKPTQSLNWWMAPTTHPKPQINPYPRAL